MSSSVRIKIVKVHMLLAAFIFPAAVMFLITGGLYTWGVKGSYSDEVYLIELNEPLTADISQIKSLMKQELHKLSIEAPSGQASLKKGGTSFRAEWTGSKRDVVLEPTDHVTSARLTVKETTWYRNLVQLHKAKGGQPFKIYAAVLALSLLIILTTGFVIAFQIPKYRRSAISAAAVGVVLFLVVISTS